jgi:hypothetical protein
VGGKMPPAFIYRQIEFMELKMRLDGKLIETVTLNSGSCKDEKYLNSLKDIMR